MALAIRKVAYPWISRSQTYTKPASHAHGTLVLTIHLHSTVFTPSPLKVKLRDTCERNGPRFAVNYMFMCQRHDGEDVGMLDCGDLHGILPLQGGRITLGDTQLYHVRCASRKIGKCMAPCYPGFFLSPQFRGRDSETLVALALCVQCQW